MNNILALKGYLLDPADPIYLKDTELSSLPEIQEIDEYVRVIEDRIAGDFDLEYLRFEFFYNQHAFVRNGLLLSKIKFKQLHKTLAHLSFKDFCDRYLHKSTWQVNHTINASRVFLELMYAGFEVLPANISQGQALAQLTGSELVHTWRSLIEQIKPSEITAKTIRTFLFPPTEEDKTIARIQVPATLHEEIHETAADKGLSIPELLRTMLFFFLTGGATSDNSHRFETEDNTEYYTQNKPSKEEDVAVFGGGIPY